MNLLAHTMIEKADALGLGREMMEHLGEQGTAEMMKMYKDHEKAEAKN